VTHAICESATKEKRIGDFETADEITNGDGDLMIAPPKRVALATDERDVWLFCLRH
jgi:hypothetical protein